MEDQGKRQKKGYLVEVMQKGVVEKHRYSDRDKALEDVRRMPEEENLAVAEVDTGRTLLVEKKKRAEKKRRGAETVTPEAPSRWRAVRRGLILACVLALMLLVPLGLLIFTGVGISRDPGYVTAPKAPQVIGKISSRPKPKPGKKPEPVEEAPEPRQPVRPLENGIAAMLAKSPAMAGEDLSFPYTVHAGSFRSMERAKNQVETFRNKGEAAFAAYVDIPGMGEWYRVFCGNTGTKAEAEAIRKRVRNLGIKDCSVNRKTVALAVEAPLSPDEALALERRLHDKGIYAYAMPRTSEEGPIQLLVGAFQSESRAEDMLEQLTEEGFQAKPIKR